MKTKTSAIILRIGLGLSVLAGCDSKPVVTTITNTVTNSTTSYVTNTVFFTNTIIFTNEVVKEIPVSIPSDFVIGQKLLADMTNATFVNAAESLFKMDGVHVDFGFSQTANDVLSTDDIKAKFELTLRNNGVPMNVNAPDTLFLEIDAFYDDDREAVLCYSVRYTLSSAQWIFRNNEWHREIVTTWTKGGYGTVGKLKASDALENTVTKGAEVFANDYLKANPKK